MGKPFAILIIIVVVLFGLEWFGAIDIPYVDLPDITVKKQDFVHQTTDILESEAN
ncbi:MAG: hypothetical protein LJE94_18350 [Deltaproteobacteria bacterium]|nr:hypothetical protein [Deltaproteobacteria bacterium]